MAMRVTGLNSGLDTETIIQELVAVKQTKVDDLKKAQTKLEWKQEAWKSLNSKVYKMFNGSLGNLRYEAAYSKMKTSVSNTSVASVITADTAMGSIQKLKVSTLAQYGYLTGGKMTGTNGKSLSSGSTLSSLGIEGEAKFEINTGGKTTEITVNGDTTINSVISSLQSAGLNANFDAANQRIYIGSKESGDSADFTITGSDAAGTEALRSMGILVYDDKSKAMYEQYAALDDPANAEARNAAVTRKTADLLKQYTAERTKLQKSVADTEKKQTALVEEYNDVYGENNADITDEASRTSRKTDLEAKIAELKANLEDETLTEEDKASVTAELNKAEGELSYINGYEKNASSIAESQARIDTLNADYIKEDGTAGTKTIEEAETQIAEKIQEAKDILAGFDTAAGSAGAVKIKGQDAVITLNGTEYTSSSNTFEVNGLTITCMEETGDSEVTLTTEKDVSGIYDMIKDFIKEYSEVINEMDKLYNAESAKTYEPLTDEEKSAMSEEEVKKWEQTIKDSLLRRDSTLSSVSSAMKTIMAAGVNVNGKNMSLSDFGIETLGYFNAGDNEKNAYHINGDEDDAVVKSKTNDLLAMINSDPDTVVSFFTTLSKNLYGKLDELMATSEYSSINTLYDDKKMKEDYTDYTTKIAEAEKKLLEYEDKWYSKFSAMETALARLQSNASAVTSLLGGS